MTYGTINVDQVTNSDGITSGGLYGFKNRIINGAMMIDQRNAGAGVTPTSGQYLTDRWFAGITQASKFTAQQNAASVTPPNGFINYLGLTSTSAYSIGSGDVFFTAQSIEGLNVSDLGWGTANAQTVTLSFWVRSSLTGTFGGAVKNYTTTRSYPFSYTINSANTWEQKTITIAGDQSGTWLTTNGIGIKLVFSIGSGSTYSTTAGSWAAGDYYSATGATSVVGTNGATFYITGVQLEKGSTATSFDYRPYGTELALCQRYYQKFDSAGQASFPLVQIWWSGSNAGLAAVRLSPQMRVAPSFTSSNVEAWSPTGSSVSISALVQTSATTILSRIDATSSTSPFTAGQSTFLQAGGISGSGVMQFSAEL